MTETRRPRLLVVDNEIEVCNFVTAFFEARGFAVSQANDGEEALAVARLVRPGVILLDVRMKTEDDGLRVLPRLKTLVPGARILMVTAVEDAENARRCRAEGAEDYITKPLILSDLENVVLHKLREAH